MTDMQGGMVRSNADPPEGWAQALLCEICTLTPPKPAVNELADTTPVTFVPMSAVDADAGAITNPQSRAFGAVRKGFTSFRDADVILAKITPCFENGKAAICHDLLNGVGFGSTEFHVLRADGAVVPEYVYHFVRQESFRRDGAENMTGSVGQKRVPADWIASVPIPLPPLAEQKRIVAKVEALLARVNASRERLAKVPALLKRFRQSVLGAACSGQLTADWRRTNPDAVSYCGVPGETLSNLGDEFPSTWLPTRLGHLLTLVTSGSRGWAKYYADSGSVFIRAQNINSDCLNLDDIAFVRLPNRAEGLRTKVQRDDLLITITGANVTKSARVDVDLDDAFVSQHVALVRLADPQLSEFLFRWIISPGHGRQQLQEVAYGQGKPGLNLDNIRHVEVALPPLAEQREIVRRVEALFALADKIEARVQAATARVEKITQAILAKAFRGELVPTEAQLARQEGRPYEPASVLLERIRAERPREHRVVRRARPGSQTR